MNNIILIAKIKNLLAENDGRMAEVEVCKVLSITLQEIPCGYKIPWARLFQVNQTYDLMLRYDIENEFDTQSAADDWVDEGGSYII